MKILIWDDFQLTNAGGPSGYIYNIYEYLKNNPCEHIDFVSNIKKRHDILTDQNTNSQTKGQTPRKSFVQKTYLYIDKSNYTFIKNALNVYRIIKNWIIKIKFNNKDNLYKILFFTKKQFYEPYKEKIDIDILNRYDYIHFHLITQFTRFLVTYPGHKSKTILTSHCPSSFVDEQLSTEKKWLKLFRIYALKNECKAYYLSDYLMFPCFEATEPYYKVKKIRKILEQRINDMFFVPTSILDLHNTPNSHLLRKELGLPLNYFIITFFGRHNYVKGYDILKDVGISILNKYKECVIVCAGNGDIEKPKHNRWIELGFIDNVSDYLSICDLHIIPNRDTYFDIALLEVLRAGKHVVVSCTGGNKYFLSLPKDEISAIHFFDINNKKELFNIMENAIVKKQENFKKYDNEGEKNRTLFLKNFVLQKYINQYIQIITSFNAH